MTLPRVLWDDEAEPLMANVFCASPCCASPCCCGNAPESTAQTVPGAGRVPLAKKARMASVVQEDGRAEVVCYSNNISGQVMCNYHSSECDVLLHHLESGYEHCPPYEPPLSCR